MRHTFAQSNITAICNIVVDLLRRKASAGPTTMDQILSFTHCGHDRLGILEDLLWASDHERQRSSVCRWDASRHGCV